MNKRKRTALLVVAFIGAVSLGFFAGIRLGVLAGAEMALQMSGLFEGISEGDTSRFSEDDYKVLWEMNVAPPRLLAKSVFALLGERADDDVLLTAGDVIQILGVPESSGVNGLSPADDNESIDVTSARLNLLYDSRKIIITFSTGGILESVLSHSAHNFSSGWGLDLPPSPPLEARPVVGGCFRNQDIPQNLLDQVEAFSAPLRTEADWYPIVHQHVRDYPPHKTPDGFDRLSCKRQIAVIDGIRSDLAVITFVIEGKHTYWIDTWWSLQDSVWSRLPPHEGSELICGE